MFCAAALAAMSCERFGPVYPSRPVPAAGAAFADPPPSRIVVHAAIATAALAEAIDAAAPRTGDGTFPLLGSERHYEWTRGPMSVEFSQGRIVLSTKVEATVSLPLTTVHLPVDVRVLGEPAVSSAYAVKLQSVDVHVTSNDTRLSLVDRVAGVFDRIGAAVSTSLKSFSYDLRPLLLEAYGRVSQPMPFTVGDAAGCGRLRVLDVEAGPTVLADGIEKDLALVVAPSITLPCGEDTFADAGEDTDAAPPELPPLSNVSTIEPGPFTVTIPIAAKYEELTRAMSLAFTDGKLFFSPEYPGLYLSKPEIYESEGQLVLKVHIGGPVHALGIDSDLDGDLYLVGHAAVVDNELRIPDLEPTIQTRSFLLSLKALSDGDRIRDQARAALRLDIGPRVREAEAKLGDGLTFEGGGGCFRAHVDRVEVTGVHPHAAYLRLYVAVTAHARLSMPCATLDAVKAPAGGAMLHRLDALRGGPCAGSAEICVLASSRR